MPMPKQPVHPFSPLFKNKDIPYTNPKTGNPTSSKTDTECNLFKRWCITKLLRLMISFG